MNDLLSVAFVILSAVLGGLLVRCYLQGQRTTRQIELANRKIAALEFEHEAESSAEMPDKDAA